MDNQELILALAYVAVALVGVVVGALIKGASVKETIAEIKTNKEQLNDWTGKLADAVPGHALKLINDMAQNAQDVTRFMLVANFPGVPFAGQLKGAAEIVSSVADIVEDVTDGEKEPVAPFAGKGIPQQPAA